MTTILEIHDLEKEFLTRKERVRAADAVSLEVRKGEFFSILGPSGCGKSTLLRMIAGLETPDAGSIRIDGSVVFDAATNTNVAPQKRGLGMVFQSYAVWPHMTVLRNVTFPLRASGIGGKLADEQALAALEAVALRGLADRSASQLSGGQKQRLALARAIVAKPRLVLLDEPLSNLDAQLRDQLRQLLRSLQQELGLSFVYVTHDQGEALSLSDRIAVMSSGEIQQVGTPEEIYRTPCSEFVGRFVGDAHFIAGEGSVSMVRPEDIELSLVGQPDEQKAEARIVGREYFGSHLLLTIQTETGPMFVRENPDFGGKIGDLVSFHIKPDRRIHLGRK